MKKLTHIREDGAVQMVDVTKKEATSREAVAAGEIRMSRQTVDLIASGELPKGNVLETARLAGIMAAKRTSDLIPLCHPLSLTKVEVVFEINTADIRCQAITETRERTGVEMEALSGVNSALLAIYDLSKIVEPNLKITNTKLLVKSGGKKGLWINPEGIPEKIKNALNI